MEYRGCKIIIEQDVDPPDPINDWDMLGEFCFYHRKYALGNSSRSQEDLQEAIENDEVIGFPVAMYDHSGIGFSKSRDRYPFNCPWDSGWIGWVIVEKEKVRAAYNVKRISSQLKEEVLEILTRELEIYDSYVRGEVYCYLTEDPDGETIDSCCGFFGEEGEEDMMREAKASIDYFWENRREKHIAKAKTLIRNRVPLDARREELAKYEL